jgi:hypothetical protein
MVKEEVTIFSSFFKTYQMSTVPSPHLEGGLPTFCIVCEQCKLFDLNTSFSVMVSLPTIQLEYLIYHFSGAYSTVVMLAKGGRFKIHLAY